MFEVLGKAKFIFSVFHTSYLYVYFVPGGPAISYLVSEQDWVVNTFEKKDAEQDDKDELDELEELLQHHDLEVFQY